MSGTELHEVTGAIERPADCPLIVMREDDETIVTIPYGSVSPIHYVGTAILVIALTVIIVTGAMLFATGEPNPVLALITGDKVSPALKHYFPFWMLIWLLIVSAGIALLAVLLRPVLTSEELRITDDSIEHVRRFLWTRHTVNVHRMAVRAFRLERDYEGLSRDRLLLLVRGAEIEIGEYIRPTDREWLASAANALLRD